MVLWASVILALLAGGIIRIARNDVSLARNLVDGTRAELAADSGVYQAISMLVAGEAAPPGAEPLVMSWHLGETEVQAEITDENGRIDINTAPVEMLAALFEAVGIEAIDARTLAESIANGRSSVSPFKSPVDQPTLTGDDQPGETADDWPSEADDDQSDGLGAVPDRFTLGEEILQVPGISGKLYDLVGSAITVYTGAPTPRRDRAPPLVLAALEGRVLDEDELARLEDDEPLEMVEPDPTAIAGETGFRGQITLIRIESRAVTAGGSVFVRVAVVDLDRTAGAVVARTRLWQRGRVASGG